MPVPEKAYKNLDFLNSPPARHIRILCEYEEPRQRLMRQGVHHTIVFFGSARIKPPEEAHQALEAAAKLAQQHPGHHELERELELARKRADLSKYYAATRELARRMTEWSIQREGKRSYYITSGGGPGIMEAANRGAADVPGGRSVGLGISLPFEKGVNEWVPEELAFEFHYFFTRKYWFLYLCKAMAIFPGGFGTFDELFETLTLVQTGKVSKPMPILLFGTDFWEKVFDFSALVEFGTISPGDTNLFHITDSVDDAFRYLTEGLEKNEP